MIKRLFDFLCALLFLLIFFLPLIIVGLMIKMTSDGPAVYWSRRVGKNNKIFLMPKFRSMLISTPQVATHLLKNSDSHITPFGKFIRKTSIDELPQFYSVLKGDMSLVGPRPALFNQDDLIELRTKKKVDQLRPGITGWAQVNGRDDLPIPVKVQFDEHYLNNSSFMLDLRILFLTIYKVLKKDGVQH
jgi:O-antigen biosynthesis protein WbqP